MLTRVVLFAWVAEDLTAGNPQMFSERDQPLLGHSSLPAEERPAHLSLAQVVRSGGGHWRELPILSEEECLIVACYD